MKKNDIENGILYRYTGNNPHVVIPKRVTKIGDGSFAYNYGLESIKILSGVTKIGNNAFCYCANLKSIDIPNSVTSIGDNAFQGCKNLKSIKITDGVTEIGETAFRGCDNLASIQIPSSLTYIGHCAFEWIKQVKPQYNNGKLRAFKAFYKDWTCRGFQYEVGKTYHQDGKIECCINGFHACTIPLNVFNYYHGELSNLHFAEVELSGTIKFSNTYEKVAASDIKIVRELTVQELFEIYNSMEK